MTQIGKGSIPITFDKHQIGRDISGAVQGGAKASEGSVTSTFKRLAGLAAGAFAGVQVFSFLKDSVAAARESNKVAAQSAAVIKSTGGAANVTAKQMGDLAEAVAMKTGVDDEAIQAGENLLATFTNIRNEVGKGNDIFSQATKIAVDMGVALGGDASSNAIQLGKALNDPIKGVAALTRVGVTFTEEQKNLIKTMVESGDIMGAQKVILAELNKEFGGSAEAVATASGKWSIVWGNLQEQLGNVIIPLLDKAATWLSENLPDAIKKLKEVYERDMEPWLDRLKGLFEEAFGGGKKLIEDLAVAFDTNEKTILVVIGAITVALVGLAIAWNLGPGVIITGLVLLGVGLLAAYNNVEWFRDGVNLAFEFIKQAWQDAQTVAGVVFNAVKEYLDICRAATDLLTGAISWLNESAGIALPKLAKAWEETQKVIQPLIDLIGSGIKALGAAIEKVIAAVRTLINLIPQIPGLPNFGIGSVGGVQITKGTVKGAPPPISGVSHDGGWITGPGAPGTEVHRLVEVGEFVLSREMVAGLSAGGGSSSDGRPLVVQSVLDGRLVAETLVPSLRVIERQHR